MKKQASSFLQDKYKIARLVFTDVTPAEMLAEEATNEEPRSPDARTMAKIAEASFDIDDYLRIADILHRKLYSTDWEKWRQSYKALVLLDFLLTHGPEDFAEEFMCNTDVIRELGTFKHKDEKGFDWGLNMQNMSERIIVLLRGGESLKQARLRAIRITNEIKGFGNMVTSPSESSSSHSDSSRTSSFGSYSTERATTWSELDGALHKLELSPPARQTIEGYPRRKIGDGNKGAHHWGYCPIKENDCLLDPEEEEEYGSDNENEKSSGFFNGKY